MKMNFIIPLNKELKRIPLFLFLLTFIACTNRSEDGASKTDSSISSPGNMNTIEFFLDATGTPHYLVKHKDKVVIDSSSMGFEFKDQNPFKAGFVIKKI